jgi:hypothetical protein
MNGNTWARYRLALPSEADDRSFEPQVFLTEPMNPMSYPDDFTAANFTVVTRYLSRIDLDPGRPADDADTITSAWPRAGFVSARSTSLASTTNSTRCKR